MKILIHNLDVTAHYFIRKGFGNAFNALGHQCVLWNSNQKSSFDAFDQFEPDIFWGQTYNLTDSMIKCIKERPHLKVFLRAFDSSELSDKISKKYPIGVESEEVIEKVVKLQESIPQKIILHNHYKQESINLTHKRWIDTGFKVVSNMNAADIFEFTNGKTIDNLKSDICFVGGRWGYKSKTLDEYLLPLCSPNRDLNIKIFGNQAWGIPQYCGFCPDGEVKNVLASANICPNISEPHSQEYGYDIVERPFKLLSNKCFCISDDVKDLKSLIPEGIVYCNSKDKFKDQIFYYLNREKERKEIAQIGYDNVIENHTYLDRASEILKHFNFDNEYELSLLKNKDIKGRVCRS